MSCGDEILVMIKDAENQAPVEMTDCPVCGWTLEKNKAGILHCPFGDWSSA